MRNSFTLSYTGIFDRLINDIKLSNNGINISVKALWDTGATITCISPEIARKLKLKPFGQVSVNNASGDDRSFIYRTDVSFLNIRFKKKTIYTANIHSQGIDMLIGMDIINLGDLAITNKNGKTKFTFEIPSSRDIDFVKENKK